MDKTTINGYPTRTKGEEIEQNRTGIWKPLREFNLSEAELFHIKTTIGDIETVECWLRNPVLYRDVLKLHQKKKEKDETCWMCGAEIHRGFTNAYGEVEWTCDNCGTCSND